MLTCFLRPLGFGAVLGLAVGAARVVAERKAAQYYRKSTGRLPNADSVND